jgi:hypothetical protein
VDPFGRQRYSVTRDAPYGFPATGDV